MTNEQQQSPIFCLDKLKKHLYNTIWGIKPLLMESETNGTIRIQCGTRMERLNIWRVLPFADDIL
jgi:hypothetical protein